LPAGPTRPAGDPAQPVTRAAGNPRGRRRGPAPRGPADGSRTGASRSRMWLNAWS